MSTSIPSDDPYRAPDTDHWAPLATTLKVSDVPVGAININVNGRQIVSPLQGFGPLWQKTFRLRLSGVTASAAEVTQVWKENFP